MCQSSQVIYYVGSPDCSHCHLLAIFLDLQTTYLPKDVHLICVPKEGKGLTAAHLEILRAAKLTSEDTIIWDFDCTLAVTASAGMFVILLRRKQ